ncbi:transglutaminase-like domain-containing protein [Endozoicomonas sp. ALB032]|uniref:transglutaminase-like domain-containing protein n=1 Tax=Endozoicomonas sp. ALB032 TaxID=3403082 RepID=UPI003BB616F8
MDGRIDVKIYKLGPESGVPVKIAKPDLSSEETKDVGICSKVSAKLKISPCPVNLPDKARTVSATGFSLQKTPHAFDFRFVASDDEVRQLLADQTRDKNRDITLISHPDDLSQANLVSRLSISREGRHTLRSGKLFEGSKPLTLVMDIRTLTSDDLPKFNDLLDPDNPCLYDKVSKKKRPLGEHVSLLVLASPAQLASVGQSDEAPAAGVPAAGAPGADFWRRINRPENTWQFDAQTGNDPSMNIDKIPPVLTEFPAESVMDDGNTVLIDCHLHNNWRQLLLGSPGVDQQGRIRHLPGKLESLRAGQRVILKGANWQDLAFEQTIRQMLAQQCFESNGKICQLPDDVLFYQMPVGNNELHSLFQSLSHSDEEGLSHKVPANPIIINQSNIREWLSPIAIAPEGYAVPNTCLLEQIRAGGLVTVTSTLTEAHWFRLLGSLQTIREATGLEPRLQVAHSKQQPKALGLAENDEHSLSCLSFPEEKISDQAAFSIVSYQQAAQASHWINNQPEAPLVIQVNEQTRFSQLFDNIHIASEQKAHFGQRRSALQIALTAGKPLVLLGLESNPTLAQLLEPLAVGQPLLVNGQLQTYPKTQVTILWPESLQKPFSVFGSMVATGKPCPAVDIWDINAIRHDIPRADLPEQALHRLYEAFATVPAGLCNPLPEITEELLNNLILAARRARQVDRSPQLLPCHWRKAINSVITHGTRQNPSVRDFMKVACWQLLPDVHEDQTASVDPYQLTAIINSALRLDRKFLKQNLWPLARAFDPSVFKLFQLSYKNPFPLQHGGEVPDKLCALILAHGPDEHRQAMAHQLGVSPAAAKRYRQLAIRPSKQIKRLQDALANGWQLTLPLGQTRSDAIQALASDCFHIARTANSRTEGIERIKHRLAESLAWQGSTDMPLSALARDLYHGEISQKDRESRRLSRLHDRLTDSPVIFLQGETGTGKSYFSAKMAKASGQAMVISLGPSDSEQTLMKRWQWQQHANGDRSMVQQNRALMEWAETKSDKGGGCDGKEYITLVVDEANLAKTGLLASLSGLWEPQPCIYVNGHPVKVSPKHRVILTGNPDHYAGRQMDPTLKEKLPRAYYPRLDQAFLRDQVVEPALVNQLQRHLSESEINDIARITAESVMALWQYYQELLPEHEFTPRDLTDICSWVGWYLDRALSKGDSASCEQINSLIQQSFRDVLGPEITETHQDALSALETWFAVRYHPDNTLSNKVYNHTLQDMQQTFGIVSKKIRPDFDISGSAVRELVQWLGQDLSRSQQAYHHDRKHGGRQATLIEGPAGRGKDATLDLVIESVRKQAKQRGEPMPEVYLLNACDCSWDKVCEKIQKAKVDGGIVVISEMNLIDSQHLEGELNDILAGDAHPGFHLFATINPPEYSGRKPLSPALKGRFRHLPIRQYNATELQTIAEKVLPESSQGTFAAKILTEKHCRLRAHLQLKKLPLQPTSLDLQNVAKAITSAGDFSEKAIHQCLNQHYRLYLMAANLSLEELPGLSAIAIDKAALDPEMSEWFYQRVSGIDRPWLIRHSDHNSVDENRHEIRFNTRLDKEKAKAEIIKEVAQVRWRASGLPLKPKHSDDILTQALYRHWQQRWFTGDFGRTGVDANSVFPLTEEQKQTLKLSTNQPYLKAADARIRAWKTNEAQWWPALWHQISDLPNHLVDDFINEASVIDGDKAPQQDKPEVHEKQASALAQRRNHEPQSVNNTLAIYSNKAPEKYVPEVHEKKAPALDTLTNYQRLAKPKYDDYVIFDKPGLFTGTYRWIAEDIYVTAGGEVKTISINDKHLQGAEVLIPARLPRQDQEVILASNQTLATFYMTSKDGQYPLPSLTANDRILALCIEPNLAFTLLRDRYTGLHTLFVPEAKADQSIRIAYVVEPGEAGKKIPAKEVRPAPSKRFDAHCCEGMKTVLNKVFVSINEQPLKVKRLLETIENAEDIKQRIQAIRDYCKLFSGVAVPERNKNFFQFLVMQRQGKCCHRVPVFIAFCRYFGISCRQISNHIHSFAEYSPDGGQTWKPVDLGGSPIEATKIKFGFQPNRSVRDSGTELRKIRDLLKGSSLTEQQVLAETCGISPGKLNKALKTKGALPNLYLSTYKRVEKLWERKDLIGFSMGVSMLLEIEAVDDCEKRLVRGMLDCMSDSKRLSEAVKQILSNSDEDQITELLKSLHSKMIDQSGACPHMWLHSIVNILTDSDLSNPSVIRFAHEALKSGWLDPLPPRMGYFIQVIRHHELLVRLEGVDELKVKATRCLKMWYRELLSREKNSRAWQLTYQRFKKENVGGFFVTHCHGGFSPTLETNLVNTSLQITWTDEPGGVPNIERMLVHHPAFVQSNSGKADYRPVIILGACQRSRKLQEKAEALFQRKVDTRPDLKQLLEKHKLEPFEVSPEEESLLDDLKDKCSRAIEQVFIHYLYGVTCSKGSCLTFCWGESGRLDYFGAHDPSSPEELYAMMKKINNSHCFQESVKDDYLRQVQNASNALILRSHELTKIAEEFVGNVNLNSLYDSLDT